MPARRAPWPPPLPPGPTADPIGSSPWPRYSRDHRPMIEPAAERELVDAVGRRGVLPDADMRATYEVDWTGRFRGSAAAVVRPGDADEVAAVIDVCRRFGLAVVPQGGNTGLVGGGVPLAGEVVLGTRRLAAVEPVDTAAAQVTAG